MVNKMSKIKIQNLEISEDEFAKLAEQQGYIKECQQQKFYNGLTAEQWQQVIDEKLLVQVTDTCDDFGEVSELLHSFNKEGQYNFCADGVEWKHCRIHPSQPQFGGRADWVKDDDLIAALYKDDYKGMFLAKNVEWEVVARWQVVKL